MPEVCPYRLYNEDCFKTLRRLGNESVDMVMADPPYGVTDCKWDSVIPLEPMWKALKRVVKKNGVMVFMATQPFTSALVMSNVKMFKCHWLWHKHQGANFANAKIMPLKVTEDVVVFGGNTYYPIKTRGKMRRIGYGKSFNSEMYKKKKHRFAVTFLR